MKKWIVGALVVAGAVIALAVLTGPGGTPRGRAGSKVLGAESESSRLASQNEKFKELSRKLAEERAAFKATNQAMAGRAAPTPKVDESEKALAAAMQGPFSQNKPMAVDSKKHDQANDVVKIKDKLDVLADPKARPKSPASWDAVAPVSWTRLTQLYKGFSIGRAVGGDFKPETVHELNGAAVEIEGTVLPIDPVGAGGKLKRFWIARPAVLAAGCVFCEAPSMGDLVYVDAKAAPMEVDREKLYSGAVSAKVVGRFELGPAAAKDGTQYLFGLELQPSK